MRLLVHNRTRAGLLVICLSLIGGTGCITAAVISSAQQSAARRQYEENRRKTVEDYRAAAARGDQMADVKLALEYIKGPPGVDSKDIPKGVAMLEQEVAKQYGPAEYALGLLLIDGNNGDQLWGSRATPAQLPRQPERGIELLKKSATIACSYDYAGAPFGSAKTFPAYRISRIYRNGYDLSKNEEQADLWLARSIIHCAYPPPSFIGSEFIWMKNAPPKSKAASWLLLMSPGQQRDRILSKISPEDIQAATQEVPRLRQMVSESERQYPAPPKPTKP